MALAPLPARLSSVNLSPEKLAQETNKFTVDTINHLKSLRLRMEAMQAELDTLESSLSTTPGSVILTGAPTRGIGGSNSGGVGPALIYADHDHTLRETSGPTNLPIGDILDEEVLWRQAGMVRGRTLDISRIIAGTPSTTSTTLADISSDLNYSLKADNGYWVVWFLYYSTAATTTGARFSVNYSGTLSQIRYGILGATSLTGMQSEQATAVDTALGQAGVGPGGTTRVNILQCYIRTTTAGTLAARFASGVAASAVNVGNGSNAILIQQL